MSSTLTVRGNHGFTRLDVAATIAAISLLLFLMLPLLANSRQTSLDAVCNNNLKRIGQAFHMWANDHGDRFPFYVPVQEGGLQGSNNPLQAYQIGHQFVVLSNELRHVSVLNCPADTRPRARSFNDLLSLSGFTYLSYFLAHGRYGLGSEILSGDRNVTGTVLSGPNCTYFQSSSRLPPLTAGWNLALHSGMGHLLLTGGEVELVGTPCERIVMVNCKAIMLCFFF